MILCKDVHALLHVISLVDWPKHVKFFFFFFFSTNVQIGRGMPGCFLSLSQRCCIRMVIGTRTIEYDGDNDVTQQTF